MGLNINKLKVNMAILFAIVLMSHVIIAPFNFLSDSFQTPPERCTACPIVNVNRLNPIGQCLIN